MYSFHSEIWLLKSLSAHKLLYMISDNFHIVVEFHSIPFSSFSVFFLQVNSVVSWGSCFTHRLYLLHSIDPLVDSQENVKELRRPSVRKLVLLYISTVFLKLLITNSFLFLCKYWFHGLENAIFREWSTRLIYAQGLLWPSSHRFKYSPLFPLTLWSVVKSHLYE